jgi:phospholipase C
MRVQALGASPSAQVGTCYRGTLDHTSLLQQFAEKFAATGTGRHSDDVNRRIDQGIERVSSALSPQARRDVSAALSTPAAETRCTG